MNEPMTTFIAGVIVGILFVVIAAAFLTTPREPKAKPVPPRPTVGPKGGTGIPPKVVPPIWPEDVIFKRLP